MRVHTRNSPAKLAGGDHVSGEGVCRGTSPNFNLATNPILTTNPSEKKLTTNSRGTCRHHQPKPHHQPATVSYVSREQIRVTTIVAVCLHHQPYSTTNPSKKNLTTNPNPHHQPAATKALFSCLRNFFDDCDSARDAVCAFDVGVLFQLDTGLGAICRNKRRPCLLAFFRWQDLCCRVERTTKPARRSPATTKLHLVKQICSPATRGNGLRAIIKIGRSMENFHGIFCFLGHGGKIFKKSPQNASVPAIFFARTPCACSNKFTSIVAAFAPAAKRNSARQ